jgi:hypothetical protein
MTYRCIRGVLRTFMFILYCILVPFHPSLRLTAAYSLPPCDTPPPPPDRDAELTPCSTCLHLHAAMLQPPEAIVADRPFHRVESERGGSIYWLA